MSSGTRELWKPVAPAETGGGWHEFLRRTRAIVWKDLLIEVRTKQSFTAMAFFAALVLFIFSFAMGADVRLLQATGGGLVWIGIAFTGILSLSRTYQSEELAGGLEGLRLLPGEQRAIYVGKLLGNLALLLTLELFLFPTAAILFQLELWKVALPLAGVALLGTLGFSIIGTFYAALAVHVRARELMLPLLLFPALVPVLLGAVNATTLILTGDPDGAMSSWIRLLVAFDVIFFVVCTWIFPLVLEE